MDPEQPQLPSYRKTVTSAYSGVWGFLKGGFVTPPVGDALGTLESPALSSGGGEAPMPPFSPGQWMRAAINSVIGTGGQRTTSINLRESPYPNADSSFNDPRMGKEDKPEHDKSVVSAQRVIQYLLARFDPIYGLTPRRLQEWMQQWNLGFLRWLSIMWSQMRERDDQIKSVEAKRIFAVSRLKWEVCQIGTSPEAKAHKEALEYFYNNMTCTHILEQNLQGGVGLFMRQMMTCIGYKYAVHEIVWQPDFDLASGKDILTARLRFVPIWFFENRTGVLRYLPFELALDGIPLDAGGWIITVGDGLLVASSIAYMYKTVLALKSWVNYVDKFGIPMIIGKTSAAINSPEWQQFISALAFWRNDGAALFSKDAVLESFKVEGTGGETPQAHLVDRMDRAIARLWRGGDLSTMSRGSSGTGALPQMQQEDELAEDDAIKCSESCNFYIDRWVCKYQFGVDKPLAYFRIVPPLNVDTVKEIAVDQFLLSVGCDLGKADTMARYGRRMPDDGEELLEPPQVPASIGKGIGDGGVNGPLSIGNLFSNVRQNHEAYRAAAMRELTSAQAKALAPIVTRLEEALALTDNAARKTALENIEKDLPTIFKSVSARSGEVVTALQKIVGTALLSGAIRSSQEHRSH